MTYEVTVTREGKWWMVHIPELDGLTQARRLSEAGDMAREWIALTLDRAVDDIEVVVTVDQVGNVGGIQDELAKINAEREEAARLEQAAIGRARTLARNLVAAEVPLRDIGSVLGVSFQRVHQLVNE